MQQMGVGTVMTGRPHSPAGKRVGSKPLEGQGRAGWQWVPWLRAQSRVRRFWDRGVLSPQSRGFLWGGLLASRQRPWWQGAAFLLGR